MLKGGKVMIDDNETTPEIPKGPELATVHENFSIDKDSSINNTTDKQLEE